MPSDDELYQYLWRCAGLTGGETTRKRLVAMHENDAGRTLADQLWFTEVWIELAKLLWEHRRDSHGPGLELEEGEEPRWFRSRLDSLRWTDSYRIYVVHQTSLLARMAIRDVMKKYAFFSRRPSYLSRTAQPPKDTLLRRAIRSLFEVKEAEEDRPDMKHNAVVWLRDQRYRDLRVLCCWIKGVELAQTKKWQKAMNVWAEGDNLFREVPMEGGDRDADETDFMDTIRRSIRIASALVRADAQGDPTVARWIRRRAVEHPLYGCSPDEAALDASEDEAEADWTNPAFVGNIEATAAEPGPMLGTMKTPYQQGGHGEEGAAERQQALDQLNQDA